MTPCECAPEGCPNEATCTDRRGHNWCDWCHDNGVCTDLEGHYPQTAKTDAAVAPKKKDPIPFPCPDCGSIDSFGEWIEVEASAVIDGLIETDGRFVEFTFLGQTDVLDVSGKSLGLLCNACGWNLRDKDWKDYIANYEEREKRRIRREFMKEAGLLEDEGGGPRFVVERREEDGPFEVIDTRTSDSVATFHIDTNDVSVANEAGARATRYADQLSDQADTESWNVPLVKGVVQVVVPVSPGRDPIVLTVDMNELDEPQDIHIDPQERTVSFTTKEPLVEVCPECNAKVPEGAADDRVGDWHEPHCILFDGDDDLDGVADALDTLTSGKPPGRSLAAKTMKGDAPEIVGTVKVYVYVTDKDMDQRLSQSLVAKSVAMHKLGGVINWDSDDDHDGVTAVSFDAPASLTDDEIEEAFADKGMTAEVVGR